MTGLITIIFLLFLIWAALYFIDQPNKLLFCFIALSPIINLFWFYEIFGLSVIDIIVGTVPFVFFAVVVRNVLRHRWITGRFFSNFLWLFSAMVFPCAILLDSGGGIAAIDFSFKIFMAFISYQLVLNFVPLKDSAKLIKSILLAVTITIAIVIFQLVTGIGTGYSEYSFIAGFYGDEGTLTRMAIIGIFVSLPLRGIKFSSEYNLLRGFILPMSLVILGLALSRSATLAAILLVLFYSLVRRELRFLVLTVLIGATVFMSSAFIQSNYAKKLGKEIRYVQGERINEDTLLSGRIGRWKRVTEEFEESDYITKVFGNGRGIGPHGQWFDLLKRTGIYGLTIFTWFFVTLTWYAWKCMKRERNNPFAFCSFLLLVVFFGLSIGGTPVYNFYLQVIIFSFIAMLEKTQALRTQPLESMAREREFV